MNLSMILPSRKKVNFKVFENAVVIEMKDGERIVVGIRELKLVLSLKHQDKDDLVYLCLVPTIELEKLYQSAQTIVLMMPTTELTKLSMFEIQTSNQVLDCYYKAKQGSLYLFQNVLFFGFKKPVFIFNFDTLLDIRVTCITQRTFNIEVELVGGEIVEFAMIEQKQYESIV